MKKVLIMLAMLTMTIAANAQFEKGKTFLGANFTGLDLNYSGAKKLSFGINAVAGKFVQDNWLVDAQVGYDHKGGDVSTNAVNIGVGGRYYIIQNGLFLGANAKYAYITHFGSDLKPAIEVGYAFFISREVTIEPSLYYEHSCWHHSNLSTVGLKVGISLYHSKNKIKESITGAFK